MFNEGRKFFRRSHEQAYEDYRLGRGEYITLFHENIVREAMKENDIEYEPNSQAIKYHSKIEYLNGNIEKPINPEVLRETLEKHSGILKNILSNPITLERFREFVRTHFREIVRVITEENLFSMKTTNATSPLVRLTVEYINRNAGNLITKNKTLFERELDRHASEIDSLPLNQITDYDLYLMHLVATFHMMKSLGLKNYSTINNTINSKLRDGGLGFLTQMRDLHNRRN